MTKLKNYFNAVDLKDISQLVELMNEHGLSHFRLEKEDFELELKKGTDIDAAKELLQALPSVAAAPAAAPVAAAPAAAPVAAAGAPAAAPTPAGEAITSPMVGTFYRKPAPDAENFVNVGDSISEGQTICIIEAMKVMNEIKAEKSGKVTEICIEDGTPVQFGDDLFRLA